jgi:hypothetical protein
MPWNTPRTWLPGEVVTASLLNAQLRDNLNQLLAGRPLAYVCRTGSADYSTSSSSFVNVDATNLALTLTLNGSRALVVATALIAGSLNNSICYLDWIVDGSARAGGTNGLVQSALGTTGTVFQTATALAVFSGLAPGAHTFTLQYRGNGNGDASVLNNGQAVVLFGLEI